MSGGPDTRLPKSKVGSLIYFTPTKGAAERVVSPCSWKHRELWLQGYIVASCQKCCKTLTSPSLIALERAVLAADAERKPIRNSSTGGEL